MPTLTGTQRPKSRPLANKENSAEKTDAGAEQRTKTPPNPVTDKAKAGTVQGKVIKETQAVVIDVGTSSCKAGFVGQPKPSCLLSSTVGKPFQQTGKIGENRKEYYIGKERLNQADLKLINPLRHGIVVDWDSVQALWEYIFKNELKILPEEHAVLVSDPPLSPTTNREKYAELMFETFGIPAIYIAYQSITSMYSYGRTSGIVVECGHGVSHVVPIHEGYNMPSITGRVDYAGSNLSDYLLELLKQSRNDLVDLQPHIVEDIKKKCCYVSMNMEQDMKLPADDYLLNYELPDGKLITIGNERFRCPEALFNPSMIRSTEPGLHTLTMNSINKCEPDLKEELLSNILLCGGSTMFECFPGRFQQELEKMETSSKPVIAAAPYRKHSVWVGGSILASLKSFQQLWVRKSEYDERGPFVIYRKCY